MVTEQEVLDQIEMLRVTLDEIEAPVQESRHDLASFRVSPLAQRVARLALLIGEWKAESAKPEAKPEPPLEYGVHELDYDGDILCRNEGYGSLASAQRAVCECQDEAGSNTHEILLVSYRYVDGKQTELTTLERWGRGDWKPIDD